MGAVHEEQMIPFSGVRLRVLLSSSRALLTGIVKSEIVAPDAAQLVSIASYGSKDA
jgi:hypothetical protein